MRCFCLLILNDRSIFSSSEIPAVNVINVTVMVIIDTIAWYFFCIGPDNVFQVRVFNINPVINDGYNNRC